MELRHLRYLVAIADAGTFVRAAEQLRVAQPALTRQIHDLEKELEVELFDAKARKATLTPAGEVCVRLARHVIHDTEQAVLRARASNSGTVGRCIVSSGPLPLLTGMVARFVARMRALYPGVNLVVKELAADKQFKAIAEAESDIGIGLTPPPSWVGLSSETQYTHYFDHVMVSIDHPLARFKTLEFKELKGYDYLGLENLGTDLGLLRASVSAEMAKLGFPADTRMREFPSVESAISHVRAGQGYGFVPGAFAKVFPDIAAIPITDFKAILRTSRVWRSADNRPVTQLVLRELRLLQEEWNNERQAAFVTKEPKEPVQANEFVSARLDLRHLRSFRAVTSQGSLGKAAEVLEVTQPALSRQMRELEYDVGVPLLDRGTRGMELTAAGAVFDNDVASILAVVDHIPRELRRSTRATAQRCVIGSIPHPYADKIIARTMSTMEERRPRVRVGVRSIASPLQAEALRGGEIDIGVGHWYPVAAPLPETLGLATVKLFSDTIDCVMVATNHPLANAESLSVKQLATVPFLFPGRHFFPRFYDTVFEQLHLAGLRPRVDSEYDGLITIWSIAAQGVGWCVGWQSLRESPPPGLRAIPLTDFHMEWGGVVTYRQDESRVHVLATIDAIVAIARELHGDVTAEAVTAGTNTSKVTIS